VAAVSCGTAATTCAVTRNLLGVVPVPCGPPVSGWSLAFVRLRPPPLARVGDVHAEDLAGKVEQRAAELAGGRGEGGDVLDLAWSEFLAGIISE